MTDLPSPDMIPEAEAGLQHYLREIPEDVVLPDNKPTDCAWPIKDAAGATAVLAAYQNRMSRIARLKDAMKDMIAHEEREIRRLQFAVGGYSRLLSDGKRLDSWGTLEQWTKEQVAMRRTGKYVDLPFGRLQFRRAVEKAVVHDEDKFVEWCMEKGHTDFFRTHVEITYRPLLAYLQKEGNEIPTDADGVVLAEILPAGRYETFSMSKGEEAYGN